jgi:hypothetical protein
MSSYTVDLPRDVLEWRVNWVPVKFLIKLSFLVMVV